MKPGETGLTLVELIISLTIMSFIAVAAAALLSVSLKAQAYAVNRSGLYTDGALVMQQITGNIRNSTIVFVPNGRQSTRTILATSGTVNNDNDYYFAAPLFPRIDEDVANDNTADGHSGVKGIDDNGNGLIDDGSTSDNDEDLVNFEDPLDGVDNDGDGSIDEDVPGDMNGDGASGIKGMDDNGDGPVDNSINLKDDDEDGQFDEDPYNPLIYTYDSASNSLKLQLPGSTTPSTVLSGVTQFSATYEGPDTTHAPRILVSFALASGGQTATFTEYASPRNGIQRTRKKVR
jgi:type II secretory pathway pseudopilin PulG